MASLSWTVPWAFAIWTSIITITDLIDYHACLHSEETSPEQFRNIFRGLSFRAFLCAVAWAVIAVYWFA